MTTNRRVQKLESGLTPKQAFLLWIQEAHGFRSVEDYASNLKGQPRSAWPLVKLPDQVEAGVREALKGQPKEEINRAVRQAWRDVLYLFHHHQQANRIVSFEHNHHWSKTLVLITGLKAMIRQQDLERKLQWGRVHLGLEMPYPLDPETAAAVEAAKRHYVMPWMMLEEAGDLDQWVQESFLAERKTPLPNDAYKLRKTDEGASDETRGLYPDQEEFDRFISGEDYRYGLADVPDSEYEERSAALIEAIKDLGLEGAVVKLPTVPHAFLREAPLVDGDWIDRYVVELSEWDARIIEKRYLVEEPTDSHPFSWYRLIDPEEGSAAGGEVLDKLWQQSKKHLAGFPGASKQMDGRPHVSFSGYLKWRGRKAKGNLKADLQQGLAVNRWNRWVDQEGGEGVAILAGVKVSRLACFAEGYRFQPCEDSEDMAEQVSRRDSVLASLEVGKPGENHEDRLHEDARFWKEMAETLLVDLYTLNQSIDSINQRYFDGQQSLFPDVKEGLNQLADSAENLIEIFNDAVADELDYLSRIQGTEPDQTHGPLRIDLPALTAKIEGSAAAQVAYLIDMAKAEALDQMGENEKAVAIMYRHV